MIFNKIKKYKNLYRSFIFTKIFTDVNTNIFAMNCEKDDYSINLNDELSEKTVLSINTNSNKSVYGDENNNKDINKYEQIFLGKRYKFNTHIENLENFLSSNLTNLIEDCIFRFITNCNNVGFKMNFNNFEMIFSKTNNKKILEFSLKTNNKKILEFSLKTLKQVINIMYIPIENIKLENIYNEDLEVFHIKKKELENKNILTFSDEHNILDNIEINEKVNKVLNNYSIIMKTRKINKFLEKNFLDYFIEEYLKGKDDNFNYLNSKSILYICEKNFNFQIFNKKTIKNILLKEIIDKNKEDKKYKEMNELIDKLENLNLENNNL